MYKYFSISIVLIFIGCKSNKPPINQAIEKTQNKKDLMQTKPTTYQNIFDVINAYNRNNEESNIIDLGVFLRALLQCYIDYKDQKISGTLILKILKEAEFKQPAKFDSTWLEIADPAYEISSAGYGKKPQFSDYEYGIQYLKHAIGVYHKMEKEWEKTPLKQYHGMYQYHAENGHTWYYHGAFSILSNYEYGFELAEMNREEEEVENGIVEEAFNPNSPVKEIPLDWRFIPTIIWTGTCYEY